MSDDKQEMIDAYLDDRLSSEDALPFNAWLKESADHCRRFALATMLHDRLRAEWQAHAFSDEAESLTRTSTPRILSFRRRMMTTVAAIAAVLLVAVFLWKGASVRTASAADVALDRMIESAKQPVDRVYRIHVTDPGPGGAMPPVFAEVQGRKPGIDGALLYVRGSDQFVLIRIYGNGEQFVTGSDGKIGWAVAPSGDVHLSRDTRRYRRGVPGEHHEIPFIDLGVGLAGLRRGYRLDLSSPDQSSPDATHRSQLIAVKKPDGQPGPKRVEILFDASGVAQRIELKGLPPDKRAPRGVMLELIEQRDTGPDFFKHESHHAADRPIDWE